MNYNDYFERDVSNISTEVSNAFVRKVMLNMIGGLFITTLVPIYVFFFNSELVYTLARYFKLIALAEVALVFFLSLGINKMSSVIMFIVIGVYGYTTKEDLTKYSKFLMTGLITIIIISLINIFIKAPMLYWVGTILGVVIFSGLIAFDINRIKYIAYNIAGSDEEMVEKMGIIGALNLYLDFINLFLYLLRIFGKKRN